MQEKNADLGKLIDTAEALKNDEKVGPGERVKIKVYPKSPTEKDKKGPLGISDLGQETTKEREEHTKG